MRIGTQNDRLVIIGPDGIGTLDVEQASQGRFSSDPQAVYDSWAQFVAWADGVEMPDGEPVSPESLGSPVPRPRQVFAVGLNYAEHAKESGLDLPVAPLVFTKFPSSITGPTGTIELSGPRVDWEVELVVVIGAAARRVAEADSWHHIAGFTAGQDISDRAVQQAGTSPQFSLGKSFDRYAPLGPWLVSIDEFRDPDDLSVRTDLNGETVQDSRTSDLVFSVPYLVSYLSNIATLYPGDIIFTGTPSGVGMGMKPERYLMDGDIVTTTIEGIGSMTHTFADPR